MKAFKSFGGGQVYFHTSLTLTQLEVCGQLLAPGALPPFLKLSAVELKNELHFAVANDKSLLLAVDKKNPDYYISWQFLIDHFECCIRDLPTPDCIIHSRERVIC